MDNFPQGFLDLVGKEQEFSGHLFSRKVHLDSFKATVKKLRWGSGYIINMETMKGKHPTIELLIKNEEMKRARWTRPFAVREITL